MNIQPTHKDVPSRPFAARFACNPSEKKLAQLKREFEEKCAILEKEHSELGWKVKDGWEVLTDMVSTRDSQNVKNQNENIDTLLIFAGLFSAILAAFVIEAIKLLQADSSGASLDVLIQISQQLRSLTITGRSINSTHIPLAFPPNAFVPASSPVWLNALWFVALVLSLVAASLGMLIKQWLREFLDNPYMTPQERRRVRLFRARGLGKYKVFEVAAFLPLLLQVSLVFFFVGLILFIRNLNRVISWIVTGLVVVWFGFIVITTSLPWFSPSCPYKTPFLKPITSQVKQLLDFLYLSLQKIVFSCRATPEDYQTSGVTCSDPSNAPARAPLFGDDAEAIFAKDASHDSDIFLDVYRTFGNINVWELVVQCFDPEFASESLSLLYTVMTKRHPEHPPIRPKAFPRNAWRSLFRNEQRTIVKGMTLYARWRIASAFSGLGYIDDRVVETLQELDTCTRFLNARSSRRVDDALKEMTSTLIQEVRYAPFGPGPSPPLAAYIATFSGGDYDILGTWKGAGKDVMEAIMNEFGRKEWESMSEDGVLKHCCDIFSCAIRANEDGWDVLKERFPSVSDSIAIRVDSLPDPPDGNDPPRIFQWHCALHMAMRLLEQIPTVVGEKLLEALHTRSVKMFQMYVEDSGRMLEGHIKGIPEKISRTQNPQSLDWNYSEITNCKRGEYGDVWDYERLRVDFKHRMEFMLNYESVWGEEFRRILFRQHGVIAAPIDHALSSAI